MTELSLILVLSLLVGVRHAMEPDHVAALLTFSNQSRSVSASVKQGTIWSLGHSMTLIIFSVALMVFEIEVNEQAFVWFELIVGIIIILMSFELIYDRRILSVRNGVNRKLRRKISHRFFYSNSRVQHPLRAFGVGLVHGAAGSGVIIALATTMLDSMYLKLGYIILFSIGLTIGVFFLSIALKSSIFIANKNVKSNKYVSIALSTMILLVGVKLIYDVTQNIPLFSI